MCTGEMMAGLAVVERILLAARGTVVAILLIIIASRTSVGFDE